MTVYVETNFVLEIALGQQQAGFAELILEEAERGSISLATPSFSLSEPFSAVAHRGKRRRSLAIEMRKILEDLSRPRPHQEAVLNLQPIPSALIEFEGRELDSLAATVERLMRTAAIIDVNADVYSAALAYARKFGFSMPDAVICASVIDHLGGNRTAKPHYFVTRDASDFMDPDIAREFENTGCMIVPTFRECAQRLRQRT